MEKLFGINEDDEFARAKERLKNHILTSEYTRQELWLAVEGVLNAERRVHATTQNRLEQNLKLKKLKKRAGCCYTCCCALPVACFTNRYTTRLFKGLFVIWLIYLVLATIYFTIKRIFE